MATRRELITEKYLELKREVGKIFPDEIFPSLEAYDLADIVCYISFTFCNTDDIETPLREMVKYYYKGDCDEARIKQLVSIMEPFLEWFKMLE